MYRYVNDLLGSSLAFDDLQHDESFSLKVKSNYHYIPYQANGINVI